MLKTSNLMLIGTNPVYANYIGPSVMTDANSEGFLYVMKELLKMTDVS